MNAGLALVIQKMANAIHLRINADCPVELSTEYRRYYMASRGYANFILLTTERSERVRDTFSTRR